MTAEYDVVSAKRQVDAVKQGLARVLSRHVGRMAVVRAKDVAVELGLRAAPVYLSLILHVLMEIRSVEVGGKRWALYSVERGRGGRVALVYRRLSGGDGS